MTLTFDKARWTQDGDGVWLCIRIAEKNPLRLVLAFLEAMKGRLYVAALKEYRTKRSLDANAYLWVLLDKLAEATGLPKIDMYRETIRDIGGNTEIVCVPARSVDKLRSGWEHNGLGWLTDTMPSKLEGCVNVVLYYGSSTYDTKQMSRLIDLVVQECREQGIETLPPDKLALLKESWSG